MDPKQLLIQSLQAAVAAAGPLKILPDHLPHPPSGRTLVIGAGKAAASMALAVEQHWPRDTALEGLVVTRYRHAASGSSKPDTLSPTRPASPPRKRFCSGSGALRRATCSSPTYPAA